MTTAVSPPAGLAEVVEDAADAAAAAGWAVVGGPVEITDVVDATADVTAGALFCCVRGQRVDGHDLAAGAVAAGAVGVVVDRLLDLACPQVVVPDVRRAMGWIAAAFHGRPSRRLKVVGVTGTNGKTTTTHLVAAVLRDAGVPTATIGTLSGVRTTPEAPRLQRELATMAAAGIEVVAMEVSSHALHQSRVDGTWFTVGAFTNLSAEHLDYHGTMEAYFEAKASLFDPARIGAAVVVADDDWGRRLLGRLTVPTSAVTMAAATDLELDLDGSRFGWRDTPVQLPIPGRFNVMNALVAAEICLQLGLDPPRIAAGLAGVGVVPGRIERVQVAGDARRVIVDYAHTPDGLVQLLSTVREIMGDGRLIVVFGCGGDRDRAKRPLMGAAAARHADLAIVTSDNPRSEDPAAIIAEAVAGTVEGPGEIRVEPDRRAAIAAALAVAAPTDVVVVAGKGHETTQTIGAEAHPFDDRAVVRELLGAGAAS
jgi:UDP-N-acetylmuramoyl-L-alanyl-D-glutamate--2,6-diaminopimelate ligase